MSRSACQAWLVLLILSACAPGPTPDPEVDAFDAGTTVTARVEEVVTACVVDAACTVRLLFSDTTVTATWGLGERPDPGCGIPVEVSDLAFTLEPGDLLRVEVAACADVGLVVRSLARARGGTG